MKPPDETLMDIYGAIEERLDDATSLDGVSEVEADLIATVAAHGIVGNGGFNYWYQGKRAEDSRRVAEAFDRIGMPHYAAAVRDSIALLPPGWDALDGKARYDALDTLEQAFEPLNEVLWDIHDRDALDRASIRYALARRDDLIAAWKGYRKLLDKLAKSSPS